MLKFEIPTFKMVDVPISEERLKKNYNERNIKKEFEK